MSKKNEIPEAQPYLDQMVEDMRDLSIEEWLEFLTDLRDEVAVRIRMSENDLKNQQPKP